MPISEIRLVQQSCTRHMALELVYKRGRDHRHAIAKTFAFTDDDLEPRELHVLHPKPQAFQDAHTGAVKKAQHQARRAVRARKHTPDFLFRQHDRQTCGALGGFHVVEPRQLGPKHFLVQEEQRAPRLVMGRCRNIALRREVREKRLHVNGTALAGMAQAAKAHEAPSPVDVSLLSAQAVVLAPDHRADLIKQPGRLGLIAETRLLCPCSASWQDRKPLIGCRHGCVYCNYIQSGDALQGVP
ncbi:MAG: hypothetical protein JWN13_2440 [Betaproteobacteria bacterium]|nr:hypothetical protein [Betaproteobacteria bacterium]